MSTFLRLYCLSLQKVIYSNLVCLSRIKLKNITHSQMPNTL